MDILHQLEADLSAVLRQLNDDSNVKQVSDQSKDILAKHQSTLSCLSLNCNSEEAASMAESQARISGLSRDISHRLIGIKHQQQRAQLGINRQPAQVDNKGASGYTADTLATDIAQRLKTLDTELFDQVTLSGANVASMERSARSVQALNKRYRDFHSVSGESKRLVQRHVAKKKRDVMMMKGAIAVFGLVCLFVFMRRMPLVWLVMRLLYRCAPMLFAHRRRPPMNNPDIPPEL